jgi:hypothetical protein
VIPVSNFNHLFLCFFVSLFLISFVSPLSSFPSPSSVSNLVGGTISKTTLLFGILSVYSIFAGYPFLHPSYTISLVMIILSAGCAGGIVYLNDQLTGYHGKILLVVYLMCCLIQVCINNMYGSEGGNPSESGQKQHRHQANQHGSAGTAS